MITETSDRWNFIGGSEANMIYMGYQTKTFLNWWTMKLRGEHEESPLNLHMAVGTILEHSVIDLYESLHNVSGQRDGTAIKGIARANTDYICGDKVSDVKVSKKAQEWAQKGKVPINYKRQLIHYCHVHDLNKASIIAYQCDEDLLANPFQKLSRDKLFEIEVEITDKDIQKHKEKLDYLEECRDLGIYPV